MEDKFETPFEFSGVHNYEGYENSACVSKLGNGTCKQSRNCEPYFNYKIPHWKFKHCDDETICCVTTKREATDTKPQMNTNRFATTMKTTTSTTSTIAAHIQFLQPQQKSAVPSSSDGGNSCNTILMTGNCYEGNSCTSPSGNGTCKRFIHCTSYAGAIHNICSRDIICCPLITQSPNHKQNVRSFGSVADINRSLSIGTPIASNLTLSSNVTLRPNTENLISLASVLGKSCNNLSGPGTCKNITECDAFLQRKIDHREMKRCGVRMILCCPTTLAPKSPEGNYCYISPIASGNCTVLQQCQSFLQGAVRNETLKRCLDASNPTKDIVCCPPVTHTSEKPRLFTTTTKPTAPIQRPKPQVRPAEKVCEIYKATNPQRLLTHMPGVKDARTGEFPHVGIVIAPNRKGGPNLMQYCGAALIAQRFALTTANCARRLPLGAIVRFGSVDTDPNKNIGQSIVANVKNIWIADDNKGTEDYHDLALLEFVADIPLSRSVHPACLRVEEEDLPRSVDLQVNGWSSNDESNDYMSPILYTSARNTFPLTGCNFTHYELGVSRRSIEGIQPGQYCTRNSKLGQCDGDIGFPLMRDINGQFEIVGIMSLEFGCNSQLPSIYTRVAHYIDWIEDIVWPKLTQDYIASHGTK